MVCLYIISRVDFFCSFPGFLRSLEKRKVISNSTLRSHRYYQDRATPEKRACACDWHYSSFIMGRANKMINPTSVGDPWPTPTLLSSAHACKYSRLLRHPICNVTNENYRSFPERVRNCSYNLFFSVQLASYFKKTEFLQGEDKGAAGKGEAVDEGNHTEALESKRADARSLEGWACGTGTGGAEHSVQRAKVKTWGPPKRRQQQGHWAYAQSCPHNELVID